MKEIDERNLEGVSGGEGSGKPFDLAAWKLKNCDICQVARCTDSIRELMFLQARDQWENGDADWPCFHRH